MLRSTQAANVGQTLSEGCKRLIANAVNAYNLLLLSEKILQRSHGKFYTSFNLPQILLPAIKEKAG